MATYRVSLVAGEVEVGTSNPPTLQGIVHKGMSEWTRPGGPRLIAQALAKYGLTAVVTDDDDVVVYCS